MYNLDALMMGLGNLFTPYILALFVIGFLLGFVVGAIPGFNDANLMAILLPFTLFLDTTGALVTMATIYGAAQSSGAIPAILLNIPGTPGNAATVLEGYPMARQGRAGYALGVSFAASAVGGVLGGIGALIFAPIIGTFALGFGPAEMFLVGAFGLTVVSSLTGEGIAKGMLAVFFGLLLGMIGADSMTAFPRGTFGIIELYDGLPLIPVLLGLFGLSELLFLMRQGKIAENVDRNSGIGDVMGGVRDTFRYYFNLLYSSAIGFIVGLIPGAGATIGSFVAYGQARQWSRQREKFGTGHVEGLIASEAANNSVAAAAVVPVLTLGLPGSASTTIMLAALFLQGVVPGPRLFLNFQVEAYTILLSLVLTGILSLVWGIPLARVFRQVTYLPASYLVPTVAVLLFAGAFAWRFNAFDIIIMIAFGLIGALFKLYRYSIPAFLLAIILAPLMESNYLRTLTIGDHTLFWDSTISKLMIGLIGLSLIAPLLLAVFGGRRRDEPVG